MGGRRTGASDMQGGFDDMEELAMSQRTLERSVSALTIDMTRKFEEMMEMQREIRAALSASKAGSSTDGAPAKLIRSVSRTKIENAVARRRSSSAANEPVTRTLPSPIVGSRKVFPKTDDVENFSGAVSAGESERE